MNIIKWLKPLTLIALLLASLGVMAKEVPQPAQEITIRTDTPQALPDRVKKILRKYKVSEDALSIYIKDVHAQGALIQHKIDTPRNPASTMKLLTTWGVLKELGAAYRWKTEVWTRGEIHNGVLVGDLIIKGKGDPFLTYEHFWQLLHDLKIKGLRSIQGNLLIDNSYFTVTQRDRAAFDNQPERVYNALPAATMFNFHASRFLLTPNKEENKVDLGIFPSIPNLQIDNQLQLVKGRCRSRHTRPKLKQINGRWVMKGKYSADCGQRFVMRLVSEPEQHIFHAFRDFWLGMGGKLSGQVGTTVVQEGDKRFHTYVSAPLASQIRLINKWSNNVMTRQLLLTLAAKKSEQPTEQQGYALLKAALEEQGLNTLGLVIENGSGLSRKARVSASLLGELLLKAWHDPYRPEFISSLPLLGEDGTLFQRFNRHDLRGRGHLKTGTLQNVSALAGYLLTRNGRHLAVVIQHNGKRAGRAGHAIQNALLEWAFEQ